MNAMIYINGCFTGVQNLIDNQKTKIIMAITESQDFRRQRRLLIDFQHHFLYG